SLVRFRTNAPASSVTIAWTSTKLVSALNVTEGGGTVPGCCDATTAAHPRNASVRIQVRRIASRLRSRGLCRRDPNILARRRGQGDDVSSRSRQLPGEFGVQTEDARVHVRG